MLAFDTETTDLLKPDATELWLQPYMIEIYVCKFDKDFKIYDELETFVNPGVPIPEHITKITGIDDHMVKDAPTFIQIYEQLCDFFLGERDIFAHNCTFDIQILKNSLARHNLEWKFPWPSNHHCTVEISQCLQNKRLNLAKLCELAGVEYEDGHRAKNDVQMMVQCIKWLHEQELI